MRPVKLRGSNEQNGLHSRKQMRKAKLKEKKMKRALHYANKYKTDKVCIKKEDLKQISKLNSSTNLPSLLEGKFLINSFQKYQKPGSNDAKSKKGKQKKELNKENDAEKLEESDLDDGSFKIINSDKARLARLHEFVNKESKKLTQTEKMNDKSNENSKNLIKDKDKLQELRYAQDQDSKEISKLEKKLNSKEKNCSDFDSEFGDLIRNIESGVTSGMNGSFDTNQGLSYNFNSSDDANSESESEDNLNENSHKLSGSEHEENLKENGHESSENAEEEEKSEFDVHSFFDDEAEEGTDSDDSNSSIEENCETFAFEGGGITTGDSSKSIWSKDSKSLFDLYSSDSDDDADLSDLVVDDDVIEYASDISSLPDDSPKKINKIPCNDDGSSSKKTKRRRIISTTSDSSQCSITNLELFDDNQNLELKSILKKGKSSKHKRSVSFYEPVVSDEDYIGEINNDPIVEDKKQTTDKNYHEDIYGRIRDEDGNIIEPETSSSEKYIPPAQRKLMALNQSAQQKEVLANLHKKLKGLLNRLAESNMPGIAKQIEASYKEFSRNDMNETLCKLLLDSLVTPVMTIDRLVQDHACLIATLSANVGSEVGAHVFTEFVIQFMEELNSFDSTNEEQLMSKSLDNLLHIIIQLFNFGIADSCIIYDILNKLLENFQEKEIELILLVLRSVGFTLRKSNPLALKQFIVNAQNKAASANSNTEKFSRIRFMLEILIAIKNNNIYKVPNYDPTHGEHLRTLMKSMVRQGCSPGGLKISLVDILKSKVVGKWWIVGSSWSGGLKEDQNNSAPVTSASFPTAQNNLHNICTEKFLKKAEKMHMSKPPRINILYSLTEGAETVLEATQNLLQLKIPQTQHQEIFNIILYCAERGQEYNPFYSQVAFSLCKSDRKYKRSLQFALWDKFKELSNIKSCRLANLAKFLGDAISEDSVGLYVLKKYPFDRIDPLLSDFLRQVLFRILLHPTGEVKVNQTFRKLLLSDDSILRESLRLFILNFVSHKNANNKQEKHLLSVRIKLALEILKSGGGFRL